MNESVQPLMALIAVLVLFAGLNVILSILQGWYRLAERYRATTSPHGTAFTWQTARIGLVYSHRSLTVHTTSDGIFLSVLLPSRIAHPPLFIPWLAIHPVRTRPFLWGEQVEFDVDDPSIATIRLPKRVFESQIGAPGRGQLDEFLAATQPVATLRQSS